MSTPLLVTASIIIKNDKILLVKRTKEPFKGKWSGIGGVGAFGEFSNPLESIKKEVLVDIGCEFEGKFFDYNYELFKVPTVTLFFLGSIKGIPRPNLTQCSEVRWFSKEEILKMDLAFDHNLILKKYFNKVNKN